MLLNDNLLPIAKRNFDLDDSNKIFCIDFEKNIVLKITNLFSAYQFNCEELE
ncbi:MAG: hypothetical protein IPQ27_09365 [Chitinophagaceae bacterium]|nr:hypothetical protein [Chitinophagaceae bacterium]MBL0255152.1 hypothetical protein [Chitinophagaceae bacterium]